MARAEDARTGRSAGTWEPWEVTARNLPEHARNPIHTDEGARAAGFPGALVAGVTTYAYLTHVPLATWGLEWLDHGASEVRFRAPVLDGDRVVCAPAGDDASRDLTTMDHDHEVIVVHARVRDDVRAHLAVRLVGGGTLDVPVETRPGQRLTSIGVRLEGEYGGGYAVRAGDPLDVVTAAGRVHPAVWPALANHVVHTQVAEGPWVHTRSLVRHLGSVAEGTEVEVTATVVERFDRPTGERAVLDVRIRAEGRTVVALEHEAIVRLS